MPIDLGPVGNAFFLWDYGMRWGVPRAGHCRLRHIGDLTLLAAGGLAARGKGTRLPGQILCEANILMNFKLDNAFP